MPKKVIIVMVVLLVLTFSMGVFLGTKINSKSPAGKDNNYQAGWDAAKVQLQKSGFGAPVGLEIKTLSGTVDKISGNTLTLKNVSNSDPLADSSLSVRTVQVTKDTKFYQLTQKDQVQFQKEMEEFQKKMKDQSGENPSVTPPSPQDKKEVALSDIKEGQSVSVTSSENIKDKKEFTATQIEISFMSAISPEALNAGGKAVTPPPVLPNSSAVSAPSSPVAPPPALDATKGVVPPAPPALPK
jgi:hypothetical protein